MNELQMKACQINLTHFKPSIKKIKQTFHILKLLDIQLKTHLVALYIDLNCCSSTDGLISPLNQVLAQLST